MQNRRFFMVLSLCLPLLLVSACKSAPVAEPAEVDPLAWETPADIPAARNTESSDMVRLRDENRRMNEQLVDMNRRLKTLTEKSAPVAAKPVAAKPDPAVAGSAPAAARAKPAGDTVAAAIRRAGIPDLEIDVNRNGEAFVRLSGGIAFRSGQADLMAPARDRLSRLSSILRREFPNLTLRIEGHTDSDPIRKSKWASNETLSMARAKAVSSYFTTALGWPSDEVISQGYGSERPIATNSTREGKARNRRIEIVLVN